MLNDLWDQVGGLDGVVPYADSAERAPADPPDLARRSRVQSGETLEERMDNALADCYAAGAASAVLFGSDIPGLGADIITRARAALGGHPAVVGPSTDGGYYLIGFRRDAFARGILARAAKPGSAGVVSAMTAAGVRPALMPELEDVDTLDDVRRIYRPDSATARHGSVHPRLDETVRQWLPGLSGETDRQ
jgi:hypothetical protein